MELQISASAFATARKKYTFSNFLGEFWLVYLAAALIVSYALSAGFVRVSLLVPALLLAPVANYLAYLLYVSVQKDEILGRSRS
jgi:hypothetical protein